MEPADELEPSDEFQVCYPCYLLLHKSSIVFDERGQAVRYAQRISFVGVESDAGAKSLPVFTDEDLSKRFIKASEGMANVACIFAKNDDELVGFLELAKDGNSSVVFDPDAPTGWTRRVWPIDYVITQLKNHEGLR
jgi:hypothetical protein